MSDSLTQIRHFLPHLQKERTGFMIPLIDPTLFIDPQAEIPVSFCPVCGGARYAPGERCIRCERSAP